MTAPALLFIAKPPPALLGAMRQALADLGWDRELGTALFAPDNWHQSLSHPLPSSPALRDELMRVGSQIEAMALTVVFDRLRGTRGSGAAIHWEFVATGASRPFAALVAAVRAGLGPLGLDDMPGHSPHVTVSYRAPVKRSAVRIQPLAWRIDELLLVESCAVPSYHYRTLGRWPLRAVPPGVESQSALW